MGRTGDQGCDLILTKGGEKIVCQLKRYSGPVSNKAVQEAVAAASYYGCSRAMVVTNASFTKSARKLAEANRCDMVEREQLFALLDSFKWVDVAITPTGPRTDSSASVESDFELVPKTVAA